MTHQRGKGDTFIVSTCLGTARFDSRRQARRRLAAVMAEVRRIRRSDRRILKANLRRESNANRGEYVLELTIAAPTGFEAFEIGSAVVRASIHAAGGSTAGWETKVVPRLNAGADHGRVRPAPPSSWAEVSAIAARRAAALPALPSFDPAQGWIPAPRSNPPQGLVPAGVIDLR